MGVNSGGDAKGRPPGMWRRFGALVYDAVVVLAIWMAATALLLPFTGGEAIRPGQLWYTLYLVGVAFLYFGWCWTHGGQTLGMRTWRLRLVDREGRGARWGQALVRFLGAGVSALALGIGFLWAFVDTDRRTWHDRLSGTIIADAA